MHFLHNTVVKVRIYTDKAPGNHSHFLNPVEFNEGGKAYELKHS